MNNKFEHILAVKEWQHNEYAGFEARELWRSESGQSWSYKKYNDSSKKYTPPTMGIKLYSQCNLHPSGDDNRKMYALSVKIDGDLNMRELEQARADLARMTKIEKKYTELCNKFGYPETFAKFAAYIAEIIGAELAMQSEYDNEYKYLDLSTLEWRERKLIGQVE